jgi:O-antigen/teichoic acid export membrane protein
MTGGESPGSTKPRPEQAAILVLGTTASTLAEIVTPLLMVRLITKSDLGVLSSLMLIFNTAVMIAASGFPRALLYFLPNRPRAERGAIARRVGLLLFLLGGLGGLALLAFESLADPITQLFASLFGSGASGGAEAAAGGDGQTRAHLELLSVYMLLDLPTRMLTNMLIVEGRARAAAGTALVKSLGITAATLLPAAFGLDIGGILASLIAFAALYLGLYLAYLIWLYRGADDGPRRTDVSYRELTTFSIPLGLTDIVNVLSQGLDRYLIMFFFTAAVFAEYQVGAWKIPIISTIAYAVGNVYLPRFKEAYDQGRPGEAIDIWRQSTLKVALIVVPAAGAFFVAAEELIGLLFTSEYLDAVPIFRWYTVLTLGRVTQYGGPILAAGRPRYILYASIFTLASNFVISLPLAVLVGFQGPAIGAALAFIPTVIFYCWLIAKSSGIGFARTFPLVGYLRIVALGVVASAVGWGIKLALGLPPAAELAIVLVAVCAAFGVLGTVFGMITRQDWRFALDFVRLRVLR